MIKEIEKRFLEISQLNVNLEQFPLSKEINSQVKTRIKEKKEKGEVFTPLWMVDHMILKKELDETILDKTFLDLCAGYGQFSVRWLRCLSNKFPQFNISEYISNKLFFNELNEESCKKLKYIFGNNINLFIGDARLLENIPHDARGSWILVGNTWEPLQGEF